MSLLSWLRRLLEVEHTVAFPLYPLRFRFRRIPLFFDILRPLAERVKVVLRHAISFLSSAPMSMFATLL